jgi:ribonuclease Z
VQTTFLGTAAAFATQRTNVALLISEKETNVLVECGPAILQQIGRSRASVEQIDYLFISHSHGDHILGLPMFLLARLWNDVARPLQILGNRHTLEVGKALTQRAYPELDDRLDKATWTELATDQPYAGQIDDSLKLLTLPTPHSQNAPVLSLRLEFAESGHSVVYTGDTQYNPNMAAFAAGCDLLIHEANFSERLDPDVAAAEYGHATARQAGQTAAQANCRSLALVHLSPNYLGKEDQVRAEAAQAFDGSVLVPDDGTTIIFT